MGDINAALARYPRESLTRLPTPLHSLPSLGARLGVDLWMKRDDLTDLALGGDKPRKLEYEVAAARAAGADTLVTCGSAQSNHARLTAAAARRLGMSCTVVLSDDQWRVLQGNLLTVFLLGANVEIVKVSDHWDLEKHALDHCSRIDAAGGRAHYIPVSGTTPISCLGYVGAGLEIADQIEEHSISLDAVYAPFGTGGVFTGILLALRERGIDCPMVGISVNRDQSTCEKQLEHWWRALGDLLDLPADRSPGAYELYDGFVGREYGDPTEASLDAILDMGESEGILLDPVYSGKMTAGFLDHCAAGRWADGETILLIHTGGVPALFAYQKPLEEHLRRSGRLASLPEGA